MAEQTKKQTTKLPAKAAGRKAGGSSKESSKKSEKQKARPLKPVFLLGFTGCGKSTVGRLLSIRLGRTFVDLDQELSFKTGMATAKISQRFGDAGYRTLEFSLLQELLSEEFAQTAIVAASEGIVEYAPSVQWMKKQGYVFFLKASLDELKRRATTEDPPKAFPSMEPEKLASFLATRNALYQDAAHATLETDQTDPSQVVLELAQWIEEKEKAPSRLKTSKKKDP